MSDRGLAGDCNSLAVRKVKKTKTKLQSLAFTSEGAVEVIQENTACFSVVKQLWCIYTELQKDILTIKCGRKAHKRFLSSKYNLIFEDKRMVKWTTNNSCY